MEGNQKINCNIQTCVNLNGENNVCKLGCINICPQNSVQVENKEQSMCNSYKCCE